MKKIRLSCLVSLAFCALVSSCSSSTTRVKEIAVQNHGHSALADVAVSFDDFRFTFGLFGQGPSKRGGAHYIGSPRKVPGEVTVRWARIPAGVDYMNVYTGWNEVPRTHRHEETVKLDPALVRDRVLMLAIEETTAKQIRPEN